MRSYQVLKNRWEQSQMRASHRQEQPRFIDFRLLPPAVGLWCFTALAILDRFTTALLFTLFLGALLGGFYYLVPRQRKNAQALAGIRMSLAFTVMLCCLQAVLMSGNGYPQKLSLLEELEGRGIRFYGKVIDSKPAAHGGFRTTVVADRVSKQPINYDLSVTVRIYTDQLFVPESHVTGVGTLRSQGSYHSVKGALEYAGTTSPQPMAFALKNHLRTVAVERVGADNAGLVLGMAYGDDSSLTEESLTALRVAGLTHLTAVSGSNITLIFVMAYRLAQSWRLPRLALVGAGLGAAAFYVFIVGPDGSVLRAWCMGILGAVGLLLGHGAYRITFLASCLIGLLVISPELATDFGFVLSVTATASLLVLAPALSRLLCHIFPVLGADALALPLSAALWCTPVILVLSQSFYPYTVVANILVAPLVAPITVAGLGALMAYSLKCPEQFTEFLLECGACIAQVVHRMSQWCNALPGSSLPVKLSPTSLVASVLGVAIISAVILAADARLHTHRKTRVPRLMAQWEKQAYQ